MSFPGNIFQCSKYDTYLLITGCLICSQKEVFVYHWFQSESSKKRFSAAKWQRFSPRIKSIQEYPLTIVAAMLSEHQIQRVYYTFLRQDSVQLDSTYCGSYQWPRGQGLMWAVLSYRFSRYFILKSPKIVIFLYLIQDLSTTAKSSVSSLQKRWSIENLRQLPPGKSLFSYLVCPFELFNFLKPQQITVA